VLLPFPTRLLLLIPGCCWLVVVLANNVNVLPGFGAYRDVISDDTGGKSFSDVPNLPRYTCPIQHPVPSRREEDRAGQASDVLKIAEMPAGVESLLVEALETSLAWSGLDGEAADGQLHGSGGGDDDGGDAPEALGSSYSAPTHSRTRSTLAWSGLDAEAGDSQPHNGVGDGGGEVLDAAEAMRAWRSSEQGAGREPMRNEGGAAGMPPAADVPDAAATEAPEAALQTSSEAVITPVVRMIPG